jgi:hypothetical protein
VLGTEERFQQRRKQPRCDASQKSTSVHVISLMSKSRLQR